MSSVSFTTATVLTQWFLSVFDASKQIFSGSLTQPLRHPWELLSTCISGPLNHTTKIKLCSCYGWSPILPLMGTHADRGGDLWWLSIAGRVLLLLFCLSVCVCVCVWDKGVSNVMPPFLCPVYLLLHFPCPDLTLQPQDQTSNLPKTSMKSRSLIFIIYEYKSSKDVKICIPVPFFSWSNACSCSTLNELKLQKTHKMCLGLCIQMNFGSLQCKQIWNVLSSPQICQWSC